MRYPVVFICI